MICRNEQNRNSKAIFVNFTIYFAFSIPTCLHEFVGVSFLQSDQYANFHFFQNLLLFSTLASSLSIMYLIVDVMFHDFKIFQKYAVAASVVLVFFCVYFYPFLSNSSYLYTTEDIKQWKTLSTLVPASGEVPPETELASKVTLQSWAGGVPIGTLYPEENLRRITELAPYLYGDNWLALFWKPMHEQIIKMDVLLICCMLLSFGYQYTKDPPQGAYIDKIMFLLLLTCSLEILHSYGFIKNVEWGSMVDLFSVGQYVTFLVEIALILFFTLRLKFITSVQGEYYESELDANPSSVTRWRDWLDNLVLAHFFNYKLFNGRLFQKTSGR
jgi:hypothetical protein